jgi:hypothetical protein
MHLLLCHKTSSIIPHPATMVDPSNKRTHDDAVGGSPETMVSAVPSDFASAGGEVVCTASDTSCDYSSDGGPTPRAKELTRDEAELLNLVTRDERREFLSNHYALGPKIERPLTGLPIAVFKLSDFMDNRDLAQGWFECLPKTEPSPFLYRIVVDNKEIPKTKDFKTADLLFEYVVRLIARKKALQFTVEQRDIFTTAGIEGEKLGVKYGNFGAHLVEFDDVNNRKPTIVVVHQTQFQRPSSVKAFQTMLCGHSNRNRNFQLFNDTVPLRKYCYDEYVVYDDLGQFCDMITDWLFDDYKPLCKGVLYGDSYSSDDEEEGHCDL